ncbi:hypothetical protein ACIG63_45805 [Streptomyces antimycoticus]|uniref:hypothetical protein n=1 Tax=Streptomyces antimycoticus TaxID=68175 RepID=UPI0037D8C103
MNLQPGVEVYQFIRDRLEDQRDEQHPHGHQAYVDARRKAHDLSNDYANAVHRGDDDEAARILQGLRTMAAEWKHHPDYPSDPTDPSADRLTAQESAELDRLKVEHLVLEDEKRSDALTPAEAVRRTAELDLKFKELMARVQDRIVASTVIPDAPPAP